MPDGVWSKTKIRSYLKTFDSLVNRIAVAMHVLGGLPSRGTEFEKITIYNADGYKRSLVVIEGLVVFVLGYNKTTAITGRNNWIARFLPPNLSRQVAIFVCCLTGVQRFFTSILKPDAQQLPFLLTRLGGPLVSSELSRQLQIVGAIHFKIPFTLQPYRQAAKELCRKFMGVDMGGDDSELLSLLWDEEGGAEQCGHSVRTGDSNYGRDDKPDRTLARMKKLSLGWHDIMTKQVSTVPPSLSEARRPTSATAITAADTDKYLNALKKSTGNPMAIFRHPQLPAIHAGMTRAVEIMYISPTGAGKSQIYLVPHILHPQLCTMVCVPTKALEISLKAQMNSRGIKTLTFAEVADRMNTFTDSALIIFSYHDLKHKRFQYLVTALAKQDRLLRIVIDEIHTISWASFRPEINDLYTIRPGHVPLLFLTATASVECVTAVKKEFGLKSGLAVFRVPSTIQKNIELRRIKESNNETAFATL
ncbi:hypothetical protein HDV05_000987, partial [Chytridiales sp. JEL 0842]